MRQVKVVGMMAAIIDYVFIVSAVALSPWFDVYNNALSDLGNVDLHSSSAWLFNGGLIVSGLLAALFGVLVSFDHSSWKYLSWTIPLSLAGVDLALIGFFPENVGQLHWIVSMLFFLLIDLCMLIYSFCSWPLGTPSLGALALSFGIVSSLIWFGRWPWVGVAIQETLTSVMASIWLIVVSQRNV